MLALCYLEFSVGVKAFVIELSHTSLFFSCFRSDVEFS